MDSTSHSNSRFRFRDHNQEMADRESSEGHTTADSSSISSHEAEESELQSMTAKGIQHLCSELLELKQESDEDFQKNIFSNYGAFLAILKEVEILDSELVGLKHQASSQKKLVKHLIDGICLQLLSVDTIEAMLEEPLDLGPSSPSTLETHTEEVSEMFDTLLSEHSLHDALVLLEMEGELLQNMSTTENFSLNEITSYRSAIREKRAILCDQFALVAKDSRVSAPELQEALLGLSQLGEPHLATKLLLQHYHSRIASAVHDLQSSKEFLDVLYIKETANLVCSTISQCARLFLALNSGDYAVLTQWADEEIRLFALCVGKFISSISEISGRFLIAIDALHLAMAYCSLLEPQRLLLQPSLIEHIRPCIEEVLRIHINHLSKVVGIFTSSDTWVLDRYLVSGIMTGRNHGIIYQQPEHIFLSSSARKFVTVFQSLADDVSPLVSLQMESSVLKGIVDLFVSYIVLLESALTRDTDVLQSEGLNINLPESPTQEICILANFSALMQFSSGLVRNMFEGFQGLEFEIKNYLLFVQDVYGRLRTSFLKQFTNKVFSRNDNQAHGTESRLDSDESTSYDLFPSVPYLELYLVLKKLEKLADDDCIERAWLMDLLREVMEAVFEWILNKSKTWTIYEQDLPNDTNEFKQVIFNSQFLVEIARRGGYLSDKVINVSMDLASHLKEYFITAGLKPPRNLDGNEWPADAATKALLKLQELEAKGTVENESKRSIIQEELYEYEAGKDSMVSVFDPLILDASESEGEDDEGKTDAEVPKVQDAPADQMEQGQLEELNTRTQILLWKPQI